MESESARYLDEMIRQYTRFRHRLREFRAITWRSRELESNERGSVARVYACVCVYGHKWLIFSLATTTVSDTIFHDESSSCCCWSF